MKSVLSLLLLSFCTFMVNAQTVVKLYDTIPNEIPGPDEEKTETDGIVRISKITRPTLTVFLPAKEKANGTAVVICPGGGYAINAFNHEGTAVAKELIKSGVAAFVLKYRLPNEKAQADMTIAPLQDAQQALMLVRKRAKEWNVNPDKVGIMGSSAGGHLASTAGTHFEKAYIENAANINLRPDFMILIYPVISFNDKIGHRGSRDNLLGKYPPLATIDLFSNELQVTKETPPTFLTHAGDDDVVNVENSIEFYRALRAKGVPAEMFIYPKGGHGFGLVNPTSPDRWLARCLDWMKSNKWI